MQQIPAMLTNMPFALWASKLSTFAHFCFLCICIATCFSIAHMTVNTTVKKMNRNSGTSIYLLLVPTTWWIMVFFYKTHSYWRSTYYSCMVKTHTDTLKLVGCDVDQSTSSQLHNWSNQFLDQFEISCTHSCNLSTVSTTGCLCCSWSKSQSL